MRTSKTKSVVKNLLGPISFPTTTVIWSTNQASTPIPTRDGRKSASESGCGASKASTIQSSNSLSGFSAHQKPHFRPRNSQRVIDQRHTLHINHRRQQTRRRTISATHYYGPQIPDFIHQRDDLLPRHLLLKEHKTEQALRGIDPPPQRALERVQLPLVRVRHRLQPRAHPHIIAPAQHVPGEEAVAHFGEGGGGGSKGWWCFSYLKQFNCCWVSHSPSQRSCSRSRS